MIGDRSRYIFVLSGTQPSSNFPNNNQKLFLQFENSFGLSWTGKSSCCSSTNQSAIEGSFSIKWRASSPAGRLFLGTDLQYVSRPYRVFKSTDTYLYKRGGSAIRPVNFSQRSSVHQLKLHGWHATSKSLHMLSLQCLTLSG